MTEQSDMKLIQFTEIQEEFLKEVKEREGGNLICFVYYRSQDRNFEISSLYSGY